MKRKLASIVAAFVVFGIIYWIMKRLTAGALKNYSQNSNVAALLRTIRYAEGTEGANGYRTMFTGALFTGYTDHPRQTHCSGSLCSTAAGAYQFLSSTWDELKNRLSLPDFTPQSQDIAAVELLRQKGSLDAILAGRFDEAITKANKTWASLPGSPYGQPTKSMEQLRYKYLSNGGKLTAA